MPVNGFSLSRRWTALILIICCGCGSQPQPAKPQPGTAPEKASALAPPDLSDPSAGKPETPEKPKDETGDKKPPAEKELFAGWTKPQVALVITGNQHGYLEPCGCTGLANQKGGLARRHSFLKQLAEKGWQVLPLDAGNQVRRIGPQAELQFQMTANALKEMGYRAIGLGNEDLQLNDILSIVATTDADKPGPFLSANIAVDERDFLPRHLIIEQGGHKIGVVSVIGDDLRKKITRGDVLQESVDAGLKAVLPKFDEAKCDFRILLAFADEEEAQAIAKRHKAFDLVVASSGPTEPTLKPESIAGTKSQLVHTGVKGMHVVVVGLFDDPKQPLRYERVPLDSRYPDSKAMRDLMAAYQDQLKQQGWEGLGLKPIKHAKGKFVGTKTCGTCHTQAMEVWEKSEHAHATDSLIHPKERGDIARHFDPECVSCHVTGWDPQSFVPFEGGYVSVEKTPALMQNGCENCHGPGSEHVDAEGDPDGFKDVIESLRKSMRLPLAGKVAQQKCMECHDIDNSPDFHVPGAFEKYWKQVEHKGKD
jgi:hypothetical protein